MRSCLICDDHALMREALAGTIAMHWPDATLTLAGDFPAAWAAASAQPDFILCDLGMPGSPPLPGVQALADAAPDARILIITADVDDALLLQLFVADIAGLVPKASSGAILEAAIRLVLAGGRYLPPRVLAMMTTRDAALQVAAGPLRLSGRQTEVLAKIAEGASNKEIARTLALSPATVKAHVAALIATLGVTNRLEAASRGRLLGFLKSS
jgi:DNA-binding NarL/FixJ family response regulator